jgi:hypothetical protein
MHMRFAGVGVVALATAIFLLGAAGMQNSHVSAQSESKDSYVRQEPRVYVSQGSSTDARIFSAHFMSMAECDSVGADGKRYPVCFGAGGARPNPFSQPTIAFRVSTRSDFTIDVYEVGGELLGSFDYENVERGAYYFLTKAEYWRGSERTAFVLRCSGATADSVVHSAAFLR